MDFLNGFKMANSVSLNGSCDSWLNKSVPYIRGIIGTHQGVRELSKVQALGG